jgi:hypothetical protein
MIIARSPLRITLGGGGTDLPSYYREHEGFLIAAAIDRYVYITLHMTFVDYLIVKYSKLESVTSADELQHPIIREALKMLDVSCKRLEIASMALRRHCCARCTHIRRISLARKLLPSRLAISKLSGWANRSASKTNSSPPMAV